MGQLYYFAKSEFAKQILPDPLSLIPTIVSYVVLRMKHTAHRSIDNPRHNDSRDVQLSHARSLSGSWGRLMTPKPGLSPPQLPVGGIVNSDAFQFLKQQQWRDCYLTFQLFDADAEQHVNFTLEDAA
jgi:hypothetical protein